MVRRKIIGKKMSIGVGVGILYCHSSTVIAKLFNVGTQNIPLGNQKSPIPSAARPVAKLKSRGEKKRRIPCQKKTRD
jgi:hypothetical protein